MSGRDRRSYILMALLLVLTVLLGFWIAGDPAFGPYEHMVELPLKTNATPVTIVPISLPSTPPPVRAQGFAPMSPKDPVVVNMYDLAYLLEVREICDNCRTKENGIVLDPCKGVLRSHYCEIEPMYHGPN